VLTKNQLAELKAAPLNGPNKLRAAMDLLGLTQVQLAEAIGSTQSEVSKVERGAYSRFPLGNAYRYAEFFGCSIEDLFPATESQRVAS